ncbi:MAG: carboxypeptidase regulatory-like domain-containing protein [Acidimicrobiales bacterium]
MLVEVSPTTLNTAPAEPATLLVTIVNTEQIISAHEVTILGADPAWVEIDQPRLSLFPEGVGAVTATVRLPPGIPAGTRRVAVQVREITAPGSVEVVDVDLVVPAQHGTTLELDPPSVTAGSTATVAVVLANQGNADVDLSLVGNDADQAVRFEFDPPDLLLAAGERVTASARLKAKRPLTGSPKIRQYTVAAKVDDGEPVGVTGTFMQRPRLTRGALGLVGLLAALSVFAAVIAITFGQVVKQSESDRDLVLEALRESADAEGAGGAGGISGTVTLLTAGTAVPGVTVELFAAADAGVAIANSATKADGTYEFSGLREGRYKVRFRGAGFTELWWPLSLTSEDAEELELGPGQALDGIDIRIGGVPASVAGTIAGEDPTGATVSVRLPRDDNSAAVVGSTVDPAKSAVVATVVVDASGTFLIENIPSPSVYEVSVELEGFATEIQTINLSAGEERTGLQFTLRRGDGTISGRVFAAGGALGGATVSASDGRTTVRTVSLTRDDVGAYTLLALPTPATYTVVFSAPGHVTQTLTVSLGIAERRAGVNATLTTDAGSISGTVAVAGVGPAGGVRVRAISGATQVETVTLSTGRVGTYRLVGLSVPGTYTVTFEREDLASQTRSVDLDSGGRQHVSGVDATLQPATGAVFGTVRDTAQPPNPLGEVQVTLTSGDRSFTTRTASAPPGVYEVRGLPPGTYTASFTRLGSTPAALLVTVEAGGRHQLDAVLTARASVFGRVFELEEGNAAVGARVRLFTCDGFGLDDPIASVVTPTGDFTFGDLDAPECYVLDFGYPPTPTSPGEVQQSRVVTVDPGEALDYATEVSVVVLNPVGSA